MEDILLIGYLIFVAGFAYLSYGKYDFNYWMTKTRKKMHNG